MKWATFGSAALLAASFTSACFADDIVAAEQAAGSRLGVLLKPAFANATLSVSGPNDFHASISSKGGAVAIDLSQFGALDDGTYNYQVTASSGEKATVRTRLDNGRDHEVVPMKSVAMSGTFNIKGGKIVKPDPTVREDNRRQ